jgi:hypothetical protein
MGDLVDPPRQELELRVPHEAAEARVDGQDVPVRGEGRDPDRRQVVDRPQALLARPPDLLDDPLLDRERVADAARRTLHAR